MARSCSYEVPLDTSLFTPLQLQPTAVGRLGFNAAARWLLEHVCSHRRLLWEHRVGFVLWAWDLRYENGLRFEDADTAKLTVSGRVRGPGSQFECAMTIAGPAGVAVEMRAASVPLALAGDPSLSGAPSRLPDELVQRFRDDEVVRSPYRSRIPALIREIERDGDPLGSVEQPFRVHRHNCEVADQWYWVEALSFAGAAREELVTRHAPTCGDLVAGLAAPVREIDVSYARTYQFRDAGAVATTAYGWQDGLVFVHRLGMADGDGVHATVVERFG